MGVNFQIDSSAAILKSFISGRDSRRECFSYTLGFVSFFVPSQHSWFQQGSCAAFQVPCTGKWCQLICKNLLLFFYQVINNSGWKRNDSSSSVPQFHLALDISIFCFPIIIYFKSEFAVWFNPLVQQLFQYH